MLKVYLARGSKFAALVACMGLLAACGGDGGSSQTTAAAGDSQASYSIVASVSGLAGSGLVLQNEGGADIAVSGNGSVTISQSARNGTSYAVTIKTQPGNPPQTCTVANSSGSVSGGNVTNITITCATNSYTLGGSVSGLTGSGLIISDGVESITISSAGSFSFPTKLETGKNYAITIKTQPVSTPPQNCTLRDSSGAGTVGSADVTSVQIVCANIGRFLYITEPQSNSVHGYSIDPVSGGLTALSGSPFSTGGNPGSMAVSPDSKFAYVLNRADHTVSVFSIDAATGEWSATAGSPYSVDTGAAEIALHPSGKFAYVTVVSSASSVTLYDVDASTGAWSAVPGASVPISGLIGSGIGLAFDSAGTAAYWADGSVVRAYAIDSTTGLMTSTTTSTPVPFTTPTYVAVVPDNRFVYATGDSTGLLGFLVDAQTGALTGLSGNPYNVAPLHTTAISLDPAGNFAYMTDCNCKMGYALAGAIAGAQFDASAGTPTAISGNPFAALVAPGRLVFEPSGRYAYAPGYTAPNCQSPVSVSGYSVDASSGTLSPLSGSPFTVGSTPLTTCSSSSYVVTAP
jgi:6-phosphogluconolactonase (cycloisomerase 2 family)